MASKIVNQTSQITDAERIDPRWKGLYKTGGIVAITLLVLTVAQAELFLVWAPPTTVEGFFTLFQTNWLRGLLNLDLIYIVINMLLILIYLTLYIILKRTSELAVTIALVLGLVGIAAYFSSNTAFQMFSLSNQYAAAMTEAQKSVYLSAGQSMLSTYSGTAFDVYYILNAFTLLIFSAVMLKCHIFNRATTYLGIAAGILMLIPSTAGTIGIYFSLVSLIPWMVWLVLFARRVLWLGNSIMAG
jgi:hypothetical protein